MFGNPKCPKCGSRTQKTGYAFPYPSYRCLPCIERNTEKEKLEARIEKLERQLSKKNKNE